MAALGTLSLEFARLRRKVDAIRNPDRSDATTQFIERYANGRTFVDVGGMYGIDGDVAFQAEAAGASSVTLFDGGEATPGFLDRARANGSHIRVLQGDLEDPLSVSQIGIHDLVHCAGVVYHTPHPMLQLLHLREITAEWLFISSATIPEIPGFPQACVYLPYLGAGDRAALARGAENPATAIGLGTPFDDRPMYGHANFWFGLTPSALRAMLRTARFEVVEEYRPIRYPWGVKYLARPIEEAPVMPPVDYYRRRGEGLAEGRTLPFDGFYGKGYDSEATDADAFPDLAGIPGPDTEDWVLPLDLPARAWHAFQRRGGWTAGRRAKT